MNNDYTNETIKSSSPEYENATVIALRRQLRALELQEARFGIHAPVYIKKEMGELEKQINILEDKISYQHSITNKRAERLRLFILTLTIISFVADMIAISLFVFTLSKGTLFSGLSTTFLGTLVVLLLALLMFLVFRYIKSRGNREEINKSKSGVIAIFLGVSSLFAAMATGILVNIASNYIFQLLPSSSEFLNIITSLGVSLLGISLSIYFYIKQKDEERQTEINKLRDQKIVTDKQDDPLYQTGGRS